GVALTTEADRLGLLRLGGAVARQRSGAAEDLDRRGDRGLDDVAATGGAVTARAVVAARLDLLVLGGRGVRGPDGRSGQAERLDRAAERSGRGVATQHRVGTVGERLAARVGRGLVLAVGRGLADRARRSAVGLDRE